MNTYKCPLCGVINPDKWCGGCGKAIRTIRPFCSHDWDEDKLRCKECGKLKCEVIIAKECPIRVKVKQ